MNETIAVNRKAFIDLIRVKEEFDTIVESIELSGNNEFMAANTRAKNQIKKRDFADWNAL